MKDALVRAIRTLAQAFVAIFGLQLLGWLAAVQRWASEGRAGDLPDPSVLGDAAIAGAAAVAIAAVTYVHNWLEDRGPLTPRK